DGRHPETARQARLDSHGTPRRESRAPFRRVGRSLVSGVGATRGRTTMRSMDRRAFLELGGLAGASARLGAAVPTAAAADKPVNFSGWVFKPDTVKDYVSFYNQKFTGQVKYEAIPWAQYHPTMETRAFAGEIVDVMYCNHNNRERWFES